MGIRGIFFFLALVWGWPLCGQSTAPPSKEMAAPASADTAVDPQRLMKEGLQAEALRNYPEAIDRYVQALKADPQMALARGRIISIFKSLTEQEQPRDHLIPLLPNDILDELRKLGYVSTATDQAAFLRKMNIVFWGALGLFIILVVGFLIYMFRRIKASQETKHFSTNKSLANSKRVSTPKAKDSGKRRTVITEKTRQEITGVIANVKSLTGSTPRPSEEELRADREALEKSGVLDALAQTMISEVSSEETEHGKFSKMMLDASLVFDGEDLPPDLEEYRKEHGDQGIEDYLNRLHSKEKQKKER